MSMNTKIKFSGTDNEK